LITCEVCVEGAGSVKAAEEGDAHRVELCAGLVEGGTTPSLGTIAQSLEVASIPIVVLLRPRGGDFCYDDLELEVMTQDVRHVKELGVYGIATGALTPEGEVDVPTMERIMEAAGDLSVTFHRAFDMTKSPFQSLETLVSLGVDRILTSGQERSVPEGIPLIRGLSEAAGDRISIMPGGGIREENIQEIIQRTGVEEVHFTAFSHSESPMIHRNARPLMGSERVPGEYERWTTNPSSVRRIVSRAAAGD
jgi:copper homeostasis protein